MSKTKKAALAELELAAEAWVARRSPGARGPLIAAAVAYAEAPEDPPKKPFAVLVDAATQLAADLKGNTNYALTLADGAPVLPVSARALGDAAIAYAAHVAAKAPEPARPPEILVRVYPSSTTTLGGDDAMVTVDGAPVVRGLSRDGADRVRIALSRSLSRPGVTFSSVILQDALATALITENLKGGH